MGDYRAGVSARVRAVISDDMGNNVVSETMHLARDIGVDSLDAIELACALDEEFGVSIPDDEWLAAVNGTVGDVVDLIVRLTQA